ncbi:serpin B6 [Nephila pilipes]|uniref:Serpin B6 n=1 Tax=Nephila pilipes TaxID=299642 RepID=A0A8X6UAM1_NEPPI|nr:serpin B6 [Nephila pilipes]
MIKDDIVLLQALLFLGAFFLSVAGASNQENIRKLALVNNELAFKIYRKLIEDTTKNMFFSPLSISSVFNMLYYGSEGDTAKELKKTLGYEDAGITDELLHETFSSFLKNLLRAGRFPNGTVIQSTNAVVANKSIDLTPEFRLKIKEWYEASVREVDFTKDADAIVGGVNDWIKNQTHGKINTLITELNPAVLMILLNAMYFKGAWKIPFDQDKTSPQLFFNNGRESEKK